MSTPVAAVGQQHDEQQHDDEQQRGRERRFYNVSFSIVFDSRTPDAQLLKDRFGVDKVPRLFKIADAASTPVAYPKHAPIDPGSLCRFLSEDFAPAPASRANPRGFVGFKKEYGWHASQAL